MEPTQEEYNDMYQNIEKRMRFKNEQYTREMIELLVDKHFSIFLNKAEQQAIEELIIENFKENHGYREGQTLPNGNRMCWEIQIIACESMKNINKSHMEKWYTQDYCSQIENIIKSKRL
jgi:hypothetical protein